MAAWRASRRTMAEFATLNGLNANALGWWRSELSPAVRLKRLTLVPVSAGPTGPLSLDVALPDGVTVRVARRKRHGVGCGVDPSDRGLRRSPDLDRLRSPELDHPEIVIRFAGRGGGRQEPSTSATPSGPAPTGAAYWRLGRVSPWVPAAMGRRCGWCGICDGGGRGAPGPSASAPGIRTSRRTRGSPRVATRQSLRIRFRQSFRIPHTRTDPSRRPPAPAPAPQRPPAHPALRSPHPPGPP